MLLHVRVAAAKQVPGGRVDQAPFCSQQVAPKRPPRALHSQRGASLHRLCSLTQNSPPRASRHRSGDSPLLPRHTEALYAARRDSVGRVHKMVRPWLAASVECAAGGNGRCGVPLLPDALLPPGPRPPHAAPRSGATHWQLGTIAVSSAALRAPARAGGCNLCSTQRRREHAATSSGGPARPARVWSTSSCGTRGTQTSRREGPGR